MMDKFIINSSLYVDADNLIYNILPPGARWNLEKKEIVIDDSKVEEDLEEPDDKRSMIEMSSTGRKW